MGLQPYPFKCPRKLAAHYSGVQTVVNRIVIHTMEWPEHAKTAEDCASYFASPSAKGSAHYCVDNDSIVQCVPCSRVGWHAPPNTGSIGIELAGRAGQGKAGWADEYSQAVLMNAARLTRALCKTFTVPPTKLAVAQLRAGKRGICGHVDVTYAWHKTDHVDPGPTFPWVDFINQVNNRKEDIVDDNDIANIAQEVWSRFKIHTPEGTKIGLQPALGRILSELAELRKDRS